MEKGTELGSLDVVEVPDTVAAPWRGSWGGRWLGFEQQAHWYLWWGGGGTWEIGELQSKPMNPCVVRHHRRFDPLCRFGCASGARQFERENYARFSELNLFFVC